MFGGGVQSQGLRAAAFVAGIRETHFPSAPVQANGNAAAPANATTTTTQTGVVALGAFASTAPLATPKPKAAAPGFVVKLEHFSSANSNTTIPNSTTEMHKVAGGAFASTQAAKPVMNADTASAILELQRLKLEMMKLQIVIDAQQQEIAIKDKQEKLLVSFTFGVTLLSTYAPMSIHSGIYVIVDPTYSVEKIIMGVEQSVKMLDQYLANEEGAFAKQLQIIQKQYNDKVIVCFYMGSQAPTSNLPYLFLDAKGQVKRIVFGSKDYLEFGNLPLLSSNTNIPIAASATAAAPAVSAITPVVRNVPLQMPELELAE